MKLTLIASLILGVFAAEEPAVPAASSVQDYVDCGDPSAMESSTTFATVSNSFNACCNKNADCATSGSKCVAAYQAGTWVRRICVPCSTNGSGPFNIPPGTLRDGTNAWNGWWKIRGCTEGGLWDQ